jgi:hypothetical protein
MGKREELESRAIDLYAGGMGIAQISAELEVSENSLRKWKERAGSEWDDARAAFRRGQVASYEEIGARMVRVREIAAKMTGNIQDQSQMGQILNQSVQAMLFDVMGQIQTGIVDPESLPDVIKQINTIAQTLQRTEQAANLNLRREKEIRKLALEDAADAVEQAAVQQGMNTEQAAFWRQQVLGVQ